jgi:hypothetical protein
MADGKRVANELQALKPGFKAEYRGGGWIEITSPVGVKYHERIRMVERRIRIINRQNIERENHENLECGG